MTSILVVSLAGLALNLFGAGLAASSVLTQVRGRNVWPWWRLRLRKGKDLVRRIVTGGTDGPGLRLLHHQLGRGGQSAHLCPRAPSTADTSSPSATRGQSALPRRAAARNERTVR